MRFLTVLIRILGWLLTPLVAWAACVLGAWLSLILARQLSRPDDGLALTVASGVVTGFAGLFIWMRLLRRFPQLRHTLHVTREGMPEPADIKALVHPSEEPPKPESDDAESEK